MVRVRVVEAQKAPSLIDANELVDGNTRHAIRD